MEIKRAGQPGPELAAKIDRAGLEAVAAQSFSQLVEAFGEASAVKKAAEKGAAAVTDTAPALTAEAGDEAANNYWQMLRLSMNQDGGREETSEDETRDEEARQKQKKRRRNNRPHR